MIKTTALSYDITAVREHRDVCQHPEQGVHHLPPRPRHRRQELLNKAGKQIVQTFFDTEILCVV